MRFSNEIYPERNKIYGFIYVIYDHKSIFKLYIHAELVEQKRKEDGAFVNVEHLLHPVVRVVI